MIPNRLIMSASWWFVARLQELSGAAFFGSPAAEVIARGTSRHGQARQSRIFSKTACEPLLCFETRGIVHALGGKTFDLMKLYKEKNGSILGVISEIMGVR